MEQVYLKKNQTKFLQSTAVDMPFTRDPLLGGFGYLALGKKAKAVLRGEHALLLGMDPYTF